MSERFGSFSFVDRVLSLEPASRIRGTYAIPPALAEFPSSLVAEAVGQTAAWAAMAALDFKFRPVAGIAARVELLGPAQPGDLLEMEAELETVETDAVGYGGVAKIRGQPILRLEHCVGPMLDVEQFDDPGGLRDRFALLRGPGAPANRFQGLPPLKPQFAPSTNPEKSLTGQFVVPTNAGFFADHFPRRNVFPGSLLMGLNFQLAATLLAQSPVSADRQWTVTGASDMKLRDWALPGDSLHMEANLSKCSPETSTVNVRTTAREQLIATVRVELAAKEEA